MQRSSEFPLIVVAAVGDQTGSAADFEAPRLVEEAAVVSHHQKSSAVVPVVVVGVC